MTSLTLVRRIAAPPAVVFEAMTTEEGLAAWFGPGALRKLAGRAEGGAFDEDHTVFARRGE